MWIHIIINKEFKFRINKNIISNNFQNHYKINKMINDILVL